MVQRLIGVSIGALITFLILWFSTTLAAEEDLLSWYVAAAVIGAIASFFWPIVIGFWLGGRVRARRDERIEDEVQRQLAERQKLG